MPGSKSISNRCLLLAALARGNTRLHGLLVADDTQMMYQALQSLGVILSPPTLDRDTRWLDVVGGDGRFPNKKADLYLGNAGTAIRPLTAALAVLGGEYVVSGNERMCQRPIGDLVDSLRLLGAHIEYSRHPGFPPLQIGSLSEKTNSLIDVRGDVSSQFLSSLLMAIPLLSGHREITIHVKGELISRPYVQMTIALMRQFGVEVSSDGRDTFHLFSGGGYQSPGTLHVEGDASSASYFLAAGFLGGGPVRIKGVGKNSIQGDVQFAQQLERMGATIRIGDDWIESSNERKVTPQAITADCVNIPDAAMTLAVVALFVKKGVTQLNGIGSWRVKETDRIAAMQTELSKLGANIAATDDSLSITAPTAFRYAQLDTYDDHRMAMALSLVSLGGTAVRINNPDCVTKTFPHYFSEFARIRENSKENVE